MVVASAVAIVALSVEDDDYTLAAAASAVATVVSAVASA